MTLGQALKQARTDKKLSLRDVERATDHKISNGYLSLVESDQIDQPSPHHLYALAGALELSYPELMELAGYKAPNAQGDARRLAGLAFSGQNELKDDERKIVEEFITFLRARRLEPKR